MSYVLEVYIGHEDGDSTSKPFRTLKGAVNAGLRAQEKAGRKGYGYLSANRTEGDSRWPRRVVAEQKDGQKLLWKVWT